MSEEQSPHEFDQEQLRLLRVGAGIRLSRQNLMPRYYWNRPVPYSKETQELVTALVDELWLVAGRLADYVVVYDNGGESLSLADLVSQELARRGKRDVGLLIVRRTKRRGGKGHWRVSYRPSATTPVVRLRTDADFEQIRRKTALFVVDVLEWHRKVIDVAKSARRAKNGILIAGIACLVKRDGRMRQSYIPGRVGETVPVFCLVDFQFPPRKMPEDYEALPRGRKAEDPLTPSPSLIARIARRFLIADKAPRAAL